MRFKSKFFQDKKAFSCYKLFFIIPFFCCYCVLLAQNAYSPSANYSFNLVNFQNNSDIPGEARSSIQAYANYIYTGGQSVLPHEIISGGKYYYAMGAQLSLPEVNVKANCWISKICAETGHDITAIPFSAYQMIYGTYPGTNLSIQEICYGTVLDKINNYLYVYGRYSSISSYIACLSAHDLTPIVSFGTNGIIHFPSSDGMIGGLALLEVNNGTKTDLVCTFNSPGSALLKSITIKILDGSTVINSYNIVQSNYNIVSGEGLLKKCPSFTNSFYSKFMIGCTATENNGTSPRSTPVIINLQIDNTTLTPSIVASSVVNFTNPLLGYGVLQRTYGSGTMEHGDFSFTANLNQVDVLLNDGPFYRIFPNTINSNYQYDPNIQLSTNVWTSVSPVLNTTLNLGACVTRKDGVTVVAIEEVDFVPGDNENGGLAIIPSTLGPGNALQISAPMGFCALHHAHNINMDEYENIILGACGGPGMDPATCHTNDTKSVAGTATGKFVPDYNNLGTDIVIENQTIDSKNYIAQNSISINSTSVITNGLYTIKDIDCGTTRSMVDMGNLEDEENLDHEKKISDLVISPNPSNGLFSVNTTGEYLKNIYVYDVMGKLMFDKKEITNQTILIDITDKPKGIYFVKIIQGEDLQIRKISNQ